MTNPEPEQRATAADISIKCSHMLRTFAEHHVLRSPTFWEVKWKPPKRLSVALDDHINTSQLPKCLHENAYTWLDDEGSEPPPRSSSPAPVVSTSAFQSEEWPRQQQQQSRSHPYSFTRKDSRTTLGRNLPASASSVQSHDRPPQKPQIFPPPPYNTSLSNSMKGAANFDRNIWTGRAGTTMPTVRPTPICTSSQYLGMGSFLNRPTDCLSNFGSHPPPSSNDGSSINYPDWYTPSSSGSSIYTNRMEEMWRSLNTSTNIEPYDNYDFNRAGVGLSRPSSRGHTLRMYAWKPA